MKKKKEKKRKCIKCDEPMRIMVEDVPMCKKHAELHYKRILFG